MRAVGASGQLSPANEVRLRFVNELPDAGWESGVHWHGIEGYNQADGTPLAIVHARIPQASRRLSAQVTAVVQELRRMELSKVPGVSDASVNLATREAHVERGPRDARELTAAPRRRPVWVVSAG